MESSLRRLIDTYWGIGLGKSKNNLVSGSSAFRFFFIRPVNGPDAAAVARRLLSVRNAIEVLITEGDFGFVVKAEYSDGKDELDSFIEKNFEYRKVVCYYRYGRPTVAD